MGRGSYLSHELGRVLRDGQPRGVSTSMAPGPLRSPETARAAARSLVLSVEAHAAAPVQTVGNEPALVGVRTGDAVAWLHPTMGRARPPAAASHALLGVAELVFLEHHPRTCIAAQLAAVPRDRGVGSYGVDCAAVWKTSNCGMGLVIERHLWRDGG